MGSLKVIWAVCLFFALVSVPTEPAAALGWVLAALWVTAVLKGAQKLNERDTRRRLLADCDTQHRALLAGGPQDALAYFGHYQPAGLDGKISWCAPPEAFPDRKAAA
jgi:hypothetical protein